MVGRRQFKFWGRISALFRFFPKTPTKNASLVVFVLQNGTHFSQYGRSAALGFALGLLLFCLPLTQVGDGTRAGEEPSLSAAPVPSARQPLSAEEKLDESRTVRVLLADGTVEEQTMADYLWRVVAAEMPASFEPAALSAQAVCARTYTLYKSGSGRHENADVCTSSACCQAYIHPTDAAAKWGEQAASNGEKISAAIADTDGVIATYEGAPIQAVFFSSSTGRTEAAVAVWGGDFPYLVSVDSPEGAEVPDYTTTVTLTAEEVRGRTLALYPQAELDGDEAGWIGDVVYTDSGRVASLTVGGVPLTGGEARALFSLRSTCFAVAHGEGGFTFTVTGYGHGVGLSQYGANAMARAGAGWRDILTHYYTGVTLEKGWQ